MKKFLISMSAVFLLSVSANAEQQILNPTPEFAEIFKIYNKMTPEQRAEVMATAQKVQDELATKNPAERQEYWRKAKEAMNNIDFDKVDPSKLDTKRQIDLEDVDGFLNSKTQHKSNASPTAARNPSKPVY